MDIATLIRFLSDKDTVRCMWGSEYIDTSFETMPSEFISFAENDLRSTIAHRYINALSNAKRALDCQADRLLKLFGYYKEAKDKFWGFPKKVELIQKFEILAPRILNKINKARNLMEHQYLKPNAIEVEDFLDIVSLFIASTEHYVSNFLSFVEYTNDINEEFGQLPEVSVTIDSKNEVLIISTDRDNPPRKGITIEITRADPEYINVFKQHLKKVEFR